jgi:opine dehydrogenase
MINKILLYAFKTMKFAIIGAGNGGQAIAGYLGNIGHDVSIYDIDVNRIDKIQQRGGIQLQGRLQGFGRINCATTKLSETVHHAKVIMITTTANAHQTVAENIAPYLEEGQVIILNPGRTCGALVFKQTLDKMQVNVRYFLAEAQTLIYACRIIEDGIVNIIGIKDEVYLAGLPSRDTQHILNIIRPIYPSFKEVPNVLHTSLENIGAIFHPCICLMNAATIERQDEFWFYRDMTERIADFIEQCDNERLSVGRAYGIDLVGVKDWIKVAYKDTIGETLCERMKNNPAYHDIKAPGSIFTRQLTEDIPTGVLPIVELGQVAGIATPLLSSIVAISQALLNMDFYTRGRTLANMGLSNKTPEQIIEYIELGF